MFDMRILTFPLSSRDLQVTCSNDARKATHWLGIR
jgi:hypothetical protein